MGRATPACVGAVALLIALAVQPLAISKDETIVLKMEDVGVRAVKSESLTRAKAKKVLRECRRAFAKIANRFGVDTSTIFLKGSRRPFWPVATKGRDPRIWTVLEGRVRADEMGAEAYLDRMDAGGFTIYLPAPDGDDLTPEDRHRLWREMTHAILAQTMWRACPFWLREGIAEVTGEKAADGEYPLLAMLKEELRENVDDLPVRRLLSTTDRKVWGKSSGRAVSWALVRILDEADSRTVTGLFNQGRLLLNHLVVYPDDGAVLAEFTRIAQGELERMGGPADVLRSAIAAWVRADFPEGSAFRRTAAYKSLKKLKLPKGFGVAISGRFASRIHFEDEFGRMHHIQPFKGGQATWRMPWECSMEAWIGVRGKPGTSYALRPSKSKEGYYLTLPPWNARREGSHRISPRRMDLPRQLVKFGFIWIGVISPAGLGYLFQKEYQLK